MTGTTEVKERISWYDVRAFQCTKCPEIRIDLEKLKTHYLFGHGIEVFTAKEIEVAKQN